METTVVLQIGKSKGSEGQIAGKKLTVNSVTMLIRICAPRDLRLDYHSQLACSFQPQSMIINIGGKNSNI